MNKHILFISHDASRTGAPLVLLALMRALKNLRPKWECDILLLQKGVLEDDFASVSSHLYIATNEYSKWERRAHKFLHYPLDSHKYLRFIKNNCYDLIYANSVVSAPVAYTIKQMTGTKMLLHVHELQTIIKQSTVSEPFIQAADTYIAVSSIVEQMLQQEYCIYSSKIHTIFPFSDHIFNEKQSSSDYSHVIGISGHIQLRKMADIFPILVKRYLVLYPQESLKFRWIGNGTGEVMDWLISDVKKMGVELNIEMVGQKQDVMSEYQKVDAILILSREESFSLVALEAASMGKPVVMFANTCGVSDILKNGESCLEVPYLDLDAMCEAIHRLYTNKELYNSIGEKAREAAKQCNKEQSISKIIQVMEEMI